MIVCLSVYLLISIMYIFLFFTKMKEDRNSSKHASSSKKNTRIEYFLSTYDSKSRSNDPEH